MNHLVSWAEPPGKLISLHVSRHWQGQQMRNCLRQPNELLLQGATQTDRQQQCAVMCTFWRFRNLRCACLLRSACSSLKLF